MVGPFYIGMWVIFTSVLTTGHLYRVRRGYRRTVHQAEISGAVSVNAQRGAVRVAPVVYHLQGVSACIVRPECLHFNILYVIRLMLVPSVWMKKFIRASHASSAAPANVTPDENIARGYPPIELKRVLLCLQWCGQAELTHQITAVFCKYEV
ncbi:hypothetical protein G3C52_005242 [Salmonella enterica]|uniref:hypothetical protein n=1 Tax=Salmonella enterica TaxID=28901 RepID=UPI00128AC443|nr:hypothetical protein [Salmonella enterica]EBV6706465.1 hypothetical protein [Salmonella enterica subsp. enterica serovar Anatum]ECE1043886.1 hypothetical protein [Salmonella enterica subsp. enterica]ECG3828123.1 hypothetical protein [Salmonella enterica subsp. enterica serovar Give]EDE2467759.1 hypothetical protein [Salmonella enterica subsp. enterica serovar Muenchen]EDJ3201161.1 hypothetical protein [Salmonella enterica subsp. enterica serovar Poona]EDW2153757.1 hypothetical protein [Sal